MNVEYINAEYEWHLSVWRTIRDCLAGEKAIKEADQEWSKGLSGNNLTNDIICGQPIYLPMPNPGDQSPQNIQRYLQYKMRASFYGATARTLNGMSGMVFKSEPTFEMPEEMEYLADDVDGSGVGIIGQAHEVLRDVMSVGRAGLYVDYPAVNGGVTKADVDNSGIRATINHYSAESILDWDSIRVGAASVLSYVKLKECEQVRQENYSLELCDRYRCLELVDNGGSYVYVVRVYDDAGDMISEYTPRDGAGNVFNHIPFYFIGSVNNRPCIDEAPLQEIADLNIKHYRNSADYEESLFTVGQPTLALMGMNQSWMDANYPNGIPFGSRTAITGPTGCTASLLQSQPNSMAYEGMKHKEELMISLGARLITDGGQAETAEAARIKHEADVSSLSVIVANANMAYKMALSDVARFTYATPNESVTDSIVFIIKDAFFSQRMTTTEAVELMALWQGGIISSEVAQSKLKEGGIISAEVELDDMNEAISETMTGFTPDE